LPPVPADSIFILYHKQGEWQQKIPDVVRDFIADHSGPDIKNGVNIEDLFNLSIEAGDL
jgi:hypothetical protein